MTEITQFGPSTLDSPPPPVVFLDRSIDIVNSERVPTFAEQSRQRLRDSALDALAQAITGGRPTVSMAAVAEQVGVSRQTLYHEFGDREGLLTALADRENAHLLTQVLETLDSFGDDLVSAVSGAAATAVRLAADDVLHKALLTGEGGAIGVFLSHGESLLLSSTARLSAFMLARFPQLDPQDTQLLVDVVVRFVHSHLLIPLESPEVVAAQVRRLVTRYLAGGPAGPDRTLTRVPGGTA
jgi:AcrR family transcriptional regulator